MLCCYFPIDHVQIMNSYSIHSSSLVQCRVLCPIYWIPYKSFPQDRTINFLIPVGFSAWCYLDSPQTVINLFQKYSCEVKLSGSCFQYKNIQFHLLISLSLAMSLGTCPWPLPAKTLSLMATVSVKAIQLIEIYFLPRHAFKITHEITVNMTFLAFSRIFKFHINHPVLWDNFTQCKYIYSTISPPVIL